MVSKYIMAMLFLFSKLCFRIEGVGDGGGLSYNYYAKKCPEVEKIVTDGVITMSLVDASTPSALLRLMFMIAKFRSGKLKKKKKNDYRGVMSLYESCGCDASILLDPMDATSEMASPRNFGIRKREIISLLKSMVEKVCPGQVSCADILILAARDAASFTGGPRVQVPLGRKDSFSPADPKLVTTLLPSPTLGVEGSLQIFATQGMSVEESVAILGVHTLGITHCRNIVSDTLSCPFGPLTENVSFVGNDPTFFIFDNQYYINALNGHGVLPLDTELPLDQRTAPFVQLFAADQGHFFRAFSSAFVKLSSFAVLTGDQGVIREECSVTS